MMKFKTVLRTLVAIIAFSLAASCHAQEDKSNLERVFHLGNDAYEKGDYRKAIDEYEKIIAAGYENGTLYYNLGNAYFKTGDPGKAMLNYERAKRLIPRDGDLKANYRFASNRINRGFREKNKGIWGWRPLRLYSDNFTVNELLIVISGAYMIILVLLVFAMYYPGTRRRLIVVIILAFLFGLCNSAIVWHKTRGIGKDAVVVTAETDSRYGPFDSATAFFKLHAGMELRILKEKDDWYKIERPDGKVGWAKKDDLEII
ncbi:MAG: tetratricopeptide repeat protein [Candidatus Omnitrophota bacterium]